MRGDFSERCRRLAAVAGLLDAYPDFTAEVEDVQYLGDRTVSRVLWHGHGAVSDVPMSQTMWLVAEVRQQRAIGWHYVSSEAEALEVAGP